MRLAKSSEKIVIVCLVISVLSLILAVLIPFLLNFYWIIAISAVFIFSSLFLIWTFRDPKREITADSSLILAPADGILQEIVRDEDVIAFTIRMSPFDVHMNRAPIDGVVKEVTFQKGSHWPVYFPKYAKRNQRNTIVIVNEELNLTAEVVQVSGIFARRTIAYVKPGDQVKQGERIGTIRFGSVTHLRIKGKKKYIENCSTSSSVRAGISILAQITD
ncbi:MAG: phosphatidylserine decarboxylase [Candidatus Heimdallarchaeaceae archaeon]